MLQLNSLETLPPFIQSALSLYSKSKNVFKSFAKVSFKQKKTALIVVYYLGMHLNINAQLDSQTEKLLKEREFGNKTKDTTWLIGGMSNIGFSQMALSNWSGGGQSNMSTQGLLNMYANYAKNKTSWDNSLDIAYGIIKQGNKSNPWFKNDDRIDLTSKYGYRRGKKWFYSALFNFRSQFYYGYASPAEQIKDNYISRTLAPGFAILAAGFDYQPNKKFTLFLSPATSKNTIVNDNKLSELGSFGVDPGKKLRSETGGFVKLSFVKEKPLNLENVTLKTRLSLFSNYINHPENIDINWDTMLDMKVNKFMAASISINLVYDHDILIPRFENDGITPKYMKRPDGSYYIDTDGKPIVAKGPITQFREVLAITLSYKFI